MEQSGGRYYANGNNYHQTGAMHSMHSSGPGRSYPQGGAQSNSTNMYYGGGPGSYMQQSSMGNNRGDMRNSVPTLMPQGPSGGRMMSSSASNVSNRNYPPMNAPSPRGGYNGMGAGYPSSQQAQQQHMAYLQQQQQQQQHGSSSQRLNTFESEFPALGSQPPERSQKPPTSPRDFSLNHEEYPALGSTPSSTARKSHNDTHGYSSGDSPNEYSESSTNLLPDPQYGLLGLLHNIHNPGPRNLPIGMDVSELGLDLNTPDTLYDTYSSVLSNSRDGLDNSTSGSYKLPDEITPIEEQHINFDDSTLFFMFYGAPRDRMQILASQTLYARGWRFYKKDKLWYRPTGWGTPNLASNPTVFDCFDPNSWKVVVKNNPVLDRNEFELHRISK